MNNLNDFEMKAMQFILDGNNDVLKLLRDQLKVATIQSREISDQSMYVNFEIPLEANRINTIMNTKENFCFGDVIADAPSLKNGLGFILWIKNGQLNFLEVYTFGESLPTDLNALSFRYIPLTRNLVTLSKEWQV